MVYRSIYYHDRNFLYRLQRVKIKPQIFRTKLSALYDNVYLYRTQDDFGQVRKQERTGGSYRSGGLIHVGKQEQRRLISSCRIRMENMHKLSDYAGKEGDFVFLPQRITRLAVRKQACGFSERYPLFTEKGAVILGVSKDSVASHKRFEEKYGLAFTLLADPERKVIEAYDVWKEKKNYGKVSMGVVRTTYLIDENEIIIKATDKVKAADDPENMLKELT